VQFFPSKAKLDQCRWAERRNQHICLCQLLVQRCLTTLRFQVRLQDLQTFVHHFVGRGFVDAHGIGRTRALAGEWFELGALGTHGLQPHHGGGTWQV
jgi:hypothetical protein